MNNINTLKNDAVNHKSVVNATYYWNDNQLRAMRGLNIPIWYNPVIQTNDSKQVQLYEHNNTIAANCVHTAITAAVLNQYNIQYLNKQFNPLANEKNDFSDNEHFILIVQFSNKNNFTDFTNFTDLNTLEHELINNIVKAFKWIVDKKINCFLIPAQKNLSAVLKLFKPKAILVMGNSTEIDIQKEYIKEYILNNQVELLYTHSVEDILNNPLLKQSVWLALTKLFTNKSR